MSIATPAINLSSKMPTGQPLWKPAHKEKEREEQNIHKFTAPPVPECKLSSYVKERESRPAHVVSRVVIMIDDAFHVGSNKQHGIDSRNKNLELEM